MRMKKKWALTYLVFILIILNGILIVTVNAATYPTVKPFVNDFANLMTADQIKSLDDHCAKINMKTTYEIVVVTLNSTQGDDPVSYANHIGEQNGVGKKDTDNGVVILWNVQDKNGGIAIGRGAETYLNDAKVGEIGRNARHFFDKGKYYEGFDQIVSDIEKTIYQRDTNVKPLTSKPATDGLLTLIVVILIFGLIGYLILSKVGVLPQMRGVSFGGGGGGRGFGGGSFGGGGGRFVWI